jgi:hypothetical protein
MANTFELIASYTVSGYSTATVNFNSITNAYTDLILIFSTRTDNAATTNNTRFSLAGSSSGYDTIKLTGNSATAASSTFYNNDYSDSIYSVGDNATASTFGSGTIYFPNYKGSTQKSYSIDSVTENNLGTAGAVITGLTAGKLADTVAISSISIFPSSSGNFFPNSTFYLYGVKNA